METSMVRESSSAFPLAILGLVADAPMHGYELRQKLSATLGSLRVYSYGSLYPTLRRLEAAGDITSEPPELDPDALRRISSRSRVVYRLTATGEEHLAELLRDSGPHASSDDGFEVHLALFSRTPTEARLRILESRRLRLENRREGLRHALGKVADRMNSYTDQLRQLGLESTDREVTWLDGLIESESRGHAPPC